MATAVDAALDALLCALFAPVDWMSHAATLGTEKYMKMTAMDANKKIRGANWLCAKRASNVSAWAIMSGIWTTNFMYTRFMTCSIACNFHGLFKVRMG